MLQLLLTALATSTYAAKPYANCEVANLYQDRHSLFEIDLGPETLRGRYATAVDSILLNSGFRFDHIADKQAEKCNIITHEVLHRQQLHQGINLDHYRANMLQESFTIPSNQRESLNQRVNDIYPVLAKSLGESSEQLEEKMRLMNRSVAIHSIGLISPPKIYSLLKDQTISLEQFFDNIDYFTSGAHKSGLPVNPEGILVNIMQEWESYTAEKIGIDNMNIFRFPLTSHSLWQSVKDNSLEFTELTLEEICNKYNPIATVKRTQEENCQDITKARENYMMMIEKQRAQKSQQNIEL